MSNQIDCFQDQDLIAFQPNVEGIAGSCLQATGIGTFRFKRKDNADRIHTIKLLHSVYVPDLQLHYTLCAQNNGANMTKVIPPKLKTISKGAG